MTAETLTAGTVAALRRHLEGGDLSCVLCDHGAALALPPRWQTRFGAPCFVGAARTVRAPGGLLSAIKAAVAELESDTVLVISTEEAEVAVWGENLTRAARAQGAAGVVIGGYVRDVQALEEAGLPIVAYGVAPNRSDAEGTGERNRPLSFGHTTVRADDLIVSDPNGVVVIPQAQFARILEKLSGWIAAEQRSLEKEKS